MKAKVSITEISRALYEFEYKNRKRLTHEEAELLNIASSKLMIYTMSIESRRAAKRAKK